MKKERRAQVSWEQERMEEAEQLRQRWNITWHKGEAESICGAADV